MSGGMAMSLGTILCLAGSAALVWYGGRFCGKRGGPGPASRGRGPFKDAVKELLTDWRLRRSCAWHSSAAERAARPRGRRVLVQGMPSRRHKPER